MPTHTQYTIQPIQNRDINQIIDMYKRVNWKYAPAALRRIVEWSQGTAYCLKLRRRIVATGTATKYGTQRAWIGMMVTDPGHQNRGLGARMMETLIGDLERRGTREIMLDASRMGYNLYEKMGFRPLHEIQIWDGIAPAQHPPPDAATIRPLTPDDLNAITALDADAFGAPRPHVMKTMCGQPGWVDEVNGEIVGCLLSQVWQGNFANLGCWIHRDASGADALLQTALHHLPGYDLRLSTPVPNTASADILLKYNFMQASTCTRMVYGDVPDPAWNPERYYGSVTLAVG